MLSSLSSVFSGWEVYRNDDYTPELKDASYIVFYSQITEFRVLFLCFFLRYRQFLLQEFHYYSSEQHIPIVIQFLNQCQRYDFQRNKRCQINQYFISLRWPFLINFPDQISIHTWIPQQSRNKFKQMQANNQSISLNDSRNEFMSVDGGGDSQQNQQSFKQMMQFFEMMKQNPFFKNMVSGSGFQGQENVNSNQRMETQQFTGQTPIENPIGRQYEQQTSKGQNRHLQNSPKNGVNMYRKHEKGKDVLNSYLPSEKPEIPEAKRSQIFEEMGDSVISNFQEQIPRINDMNSHPVSPRGQYQYQQRNHQAAKPMKTEPFDQRPIRPMKSNSYDEQPIRPIKGNVFDLPKKGFDEQSIKPIQENQFDQQPIQSNYIENHLTSREHEKNQQYNLQLSHFENSPRREQLYRQMQERPIGGGKDFNQNLREQLSKEGISHNFQETDPNNLSDQIQKKPSKTFLRKNTREYLSSGRDKKSLNPRKKPSKKVNQNRPEANESWINNQEDDSYNQTDRNITTKSSRATSANRVLNRRKDDNSVNKPKIDTREKKQFTGNNSSFQNSAANSSQRLPPKSKEVTPKKTRNQNYSPKLRESSPKQIKDKKAKINVFEDSESDDNDHENDSHDPSYLSKGIHSKKSQIVPGVFLTQEQIQQIVRKSSHNVRQEEEKLSKLRAKYSDLCEILEQERHQFKDQVEKEKQAFQLYKINEITKLKNEKRVADRQNKSIVSNKDSSKEELEILKKEFEREKQEGKKKDKNNRLLLEKARKEIQELKAKFSQIQQQSSVSSTQQRDTSAPKNTNNQKPSKIKEQIRKGAKKIQNQFEQVTKRGYEQSQSSEYSAAAKSNKNYLPEYNAIKNHPKKPKYDYVDDDYKSNKNASKKYPAFGYSSDSDQSSNEGNKNHRQNSYNQNEKDNKQSQENLSDQESYPSNIELSQLSGLQHLSIKKLTTELIDSLFKHSKNPEYIDYLNRKLRPGRKIIHTSENTVDGRTTHIYNDEGKQIVFTTGVRKEYFQNGYMIIHFKNGDIKQKLTDGTIFYYFKDKQVDQVTFPNQINIYRFQNNQLEFHFPNGKIEIRHPDGTIKVMEN